MSPLFKAASLSPRLRVGQQTPHNVFRGCATSREKHHAARWGIRRICKAKPKLATPTALASYLDLQMAVIVLKQIFNLIPKGHSFSIKKAPRNGGLADILAAYR
jgi:hypothetical protein